MLWVHSDKKLVCHGPVEPSSRMSRGDSLRHLNPTTLYKVLWWRGYWTNHVPRDDLAQPPKKDKIGPRMVTGVEEEARYLRSKGSAKIEMIFSLVETDGASPRGDRQGCARSHG